MAYRDIKVTVPYLIESGEDPVDLSVDLEYEYHLDEEQQ